MSGPEKVTVVDFTAKSIQLGTPIVVNSEDRYIDDGDKFYLVTEKGLKSLADDAEILQKILSTFKLERLPSKEKLDKKFLATSKFLEDVMFQPKKFRATRDSKTITIFEKKGPFGGNPSLIISLDGRSAEYPSGVKYEFTDLQAKDLKQLILRVSSRVKRF